MMMFPSWCLVLLHLITGYFPGPRWHAMQAIDDADWLVETPPSSQHGFCPLRNEEWGSLRSCNGSTTMQWNAIINNDNVCLMTDQKYMSQSVPDSYVLGTKIKQVKESLHTLNLKTDKIATTINALDIMNRLNGTVERNALNTLDNLNKLADTPSRDARDTNDKRNELTETGAKDTQKTNDKLKKLAETVARETRDTQATVNALTEMMAMLAQDVQFIKKKMLEREAVELKREQDRVNAETATTNAQVQANSISQDYIVLFLTLFFILYVLWTDGKRSTNTQTAKKPRQNDLDVASSVICPPVYLPTSNKKNSTDVSLFRSFISFIRDIRNINVEIRELTDASEQPAVLPCIGTSRLSTDVNDAFNNSQLPASCVPLLLLIHPRAPHNSYVFPTRDKGTEEVLQRVQDVIDVVASDQQIYDCDTNRKAAREFLAILNQR